MIEESKDDFEDSEEEEDVHVNSYIYELDKPEAKPKSYQFSLCTKGHKIKRQEKKS